jgi:hypothetical protein
MDSITTLQPIAVQEALPVLLQQVQRALPCEASEPTRGRGAPLKIRWAHLWVSLISSVMEGMNSYRQWHRRLCSEPVGPFEPVEVTDDALIRRLKQAGIAPLLQVMQQVSAQLAGWLQDLFPCDLAPFASRIVAIDETTLDAVQRHLEPLRGVPAGDPRLLAGKLAGRFNIRTQQWEWVQWRSNVLGNCKLEVLSLLEGLPARSLLLFDLGYFSFAWFDYLTQSHYWFVSRLREKVSYRLVHTYYRHEGILDAVIWLGAHRANRAGERVRLVRFHDGQGLRTYLTNVLDPRDLSMAQIARLYARRWDIELAFLTLKQHLGLRHWWSSQPVLIGQQCVLVLLVAQLVQAWRLRVAKEAQVDPFDVSLPLLIELLPRILARGHDPIGWVLEHGKSLGLIRPHSRYQPRVPEVPLGLMTFPTGPLGLTRLARYLEYAPLQQVLDAVDPPPVAASVSKTASAKKRARPKAVHHA